MRFLIEPPLRLRERIASGVRLGARRGNRIATRGKFRKRKLCAQFRDARAVAVAFRRRRIELLHRQEFVGDELLRPGQIVVRLPERSLGLGELRSHCIDFRGTPRFLEIGQRRFRLTHARLGFRACRRFLRAFESEQRRVGRDFIAARYR